MFFRSFLVLSAVMMFSDGFPDGAPADVCVKKRVNEPYHGASRSQNVNSLPYEIRATSDNFHAGQSIKVTINTDNKHNFRGFFLQARDADTNEWIGGFRESPNTKVIPECSSITHADPNDKTNATFIWIAPAYKHGRVFFTGSIVENYAKYWSAVIAKVPVPVQL